MPRDSLRNSSTSQRLNDGFAMDSQAEVVAVPVSSTEPNGQALRTCASPARTASTTRSTAIHVVFISDRALVSAFYGSPKAQNLQNASAHAQGREPLARTAVDQMSAVWEHGHFAHDLPVLRLLQRSTSAL